MFLARAEGEGKNFSRGQKKSSECKNKVQKKKCKIRVQYVTFSHIMWKKLSKLFCTCAKKLTFLHWCKKIHFFAVMQKSLMIFSTYGAKKLLLQNLRKKNLIHTRN
jgi:hypothetical protein